MAVCCLWSSWEQAGVLGRLYGLLVFFSDKFACISRITFGMELSLTTCPCFFFFELHAQVCKSYKVAKISLFERMVKRPRHRKNSVSAVTGSSCHNHLYNFLVCRYHHHGVLHLELVSNKTLPHKMKIHYIKNKTDTQEAVQRNNEIKEERSRKQLRFF